MLTYHQQYYLAFTWEQFHMAVNEINPCDVFVDYTFKISSNLPGVNQESRKVTRSD